MNENYTTNNNMQNFTRGGQITFHNIRMWFQVNQTLFKVCKIIWLMLTGLFTWLITPKHIYMSAWCWCKAQAYPILELLDIKLPIFKIWYYSKPYYVHPSRFLQTGFIKFAYKFPYYLAAGAVLALVTGVIAFYFISKYLAKRGEKQTTNKFIRGGRIDTVKNVAKQIKKAKMASGIVIDGMPMIAGSETKHFLVHGSTGMGKTQLISKFLDQLRKREDRVVVYDMGGVYTSTFYRSKQDKILNPLDARSENWDLWREAREAPEFASLAASLIPRPAHADPYWADSARTVFANAAYTMQNSKDRSIKNLLQYLLTAPLKDLYKFLAKTEAAASMSDKMEKTSLSIRSVMATYIKSLSFLTGLEQTEKPKFSIKDWLGNPNKTDDWLFITSISEHHESLKSLVSMWFSMASIGLMRPSPTYRRVWFVCDELPSMHQLPQLTMSLAQGRKYGGCFIVGMQNYAQLEAIYERSGAESIFDNIHARFFFRSPSSQMAELVSRELGNQEVLNTQETYSYGANAVRDGITLTSQRVMKQIVTPAEIMDLEPMKCYLRLAGAYPVTKLNLKVEERGVTEPEFIPSKVVPDQEIASLTNNIRINVRKVKIAAFGEEPRTEALSKGTATAKRKDKKAANEARKKGEKSIEVEIKNCSTQKQEVQERQGFQGEQEEQEKQVDQAGQKHVDGQETPEQQQTDTNLSVNNGKNQRDHFC